MSTDRLYLVCQKLVASNINAVCCDARDKCLHIFWKNVTSYTYAKL